GPAAPRRVRELFGALRHRRAPQSAAAPQVRWGARPGAVAGEAARVDSSSGAGEHRSSGERGEDRHRLNVNAERPRARKFQPGAVLRLSPVQAPGRLPWLALFFRRSFFLRARLPMASPSGLACTTSVFDRGWGIRAARSGWDFSTSQSDMPGTRG